jgi:hypothetical protein
MKARNIMVMNDYGLVEASVPQVANILFKTRTKPPVVDGHGELIESSARRFGATSRLSESQQGTMVIRRSGK